MFCMNCGIQIKSTELKVLCPKCDQPLRTSAPFNVQLEQALKALREVRKES
jgi:hypothetical protein